MRLVESPEDVDRLQVANPEKLAFLTQTTLSLDDAARRSGGCGSVFRRSPRRTRSTSATPRRTGRGRSGASRKRPTSSS